MFSLKLIANGGGSSSEREFIDGIPGRPDEFMAAMARLHPIVSKEMTPLPLFDVQFYRRNCELRCENQCHRGGGRFMVSFDSSTITFRSFCVFARDWLAGELPFGESVIGVAVALRREAWNIQIWMRGGSGALALAGRWTVVVDWVRKKSGAGSEIVHVEFHVHPAIANRAWKPAPRFTECAAPARASEAAPAPRATDRAAPAAPIPFNLAVAQAFKRPWSRRRA